MDTDEPLRAVPSRAPEPQLGATGVDLGGLLDLLGSHLYSSPGIVLREVVQNAHDSVTRRRLTDPGWSGGRIDVRCEPARRRLTVGDDGAGMTADELQADLATIGAGATRRERDASGSDELIGMFGIGFLSVFRVAEEVSYATSDNRQLAVHVRGMLVDDEARDMLPRWAGFVSGIVESERLAPTAAREDLHRDDAYAATQSALREALIEGLAAVARDEPETWRRVLRRHNQALTGAALVDPRLFDLLADDLLLPSADGEASARELAASPRARIAGATWSTGSERRAGTWTSSRARSTCSRSTARSAPRSTRSSPSRPRPRTPRRTRRVGDPEAAGLVWTALVRAAGDTEAAEAHQARSDRLGIVS